MREVIGIVVGFIGFFLIATYTVHQHGSAPHSPRTTAHSALPSPSVLPAPSFSEPSSSPSATPPVVKESPVSSASPQPLASPVSLAVSSVEQSAAAAPLSPSSGPPDKVIYFQSGCTGLSYSDRTTLNRLLPTLRGAPNTRIEIHGHTDDMGHKQFNLDLSRLRADIVHYYLQAQGIAESRFTIGAHGSSFPASDNQSPAGRRRNRRAEILIHREPLRKS